MRYASDSCLLQDRQQMLTYSRFFFTVGFTLCEETPGISPDQNSLSHTPFFHLYSRAQQLGFGQAFELNTAMKSFSQHKTP